MPIRIRHYNNKHRLKQLFLKGLSQEDWLFQREVRLQGIAGVSAHFLEILGSGLML